MISKDNTRILITLPKELKAKLDEITQEEQRSFSNLCCKVLTDYIKTVEKKK